MTDQATRREALLNLLRTPDQDARPVLRATPLHDLEWFDQRIPWEFASLDRRREESARPGVKATSLPAEARAALVSDEELQQFRRRCEQVQAQVRDVLHDKRAEEQRREQWWARLERAFFVLLAPLLGWLLVYLFPPPG